MKTKTQSTLAVAAILLTNSTFLAQGKESLASTGGKSITAAPVENSWQFEVVPYLWAAGLKGTTGTAPPHQ